MSWKILTAHARDLSAHAKDIQVIVTSPPYFGALRDYGHPDQIGMERQPSDYAAAIVSVLSSLRESCRDDAALWLNVGDVYAASGKGGGGIRGERTTGWNTIKARKGFRSPPEGYKHKDLTLAPFLLADALRADGWFLRSTVIWAKPVSIEPPRSDRPSTSHEYVFVFGKTKNPAICNPGEPWFLSTVWEIRPDGSSEHPATMPRELVRRCLVCCPNGLVVDPFCGFATVGLVADKLGRDFIGTELNAIYAESGRNRLRQVTPMFSCESA